MSRVDRGLVQWVRGRWVGDWGLGGGLGVRVVSGLSDGNWYLCAASSMQLV